MSAKTTSGSSKVRSGTTRSRKTASSRTEATPVVPAEETTLSTEDTPPVEKAPKPRKTTRRRAKVETSPSEENATTPAVAKEKPADTPSATEEKPKRRTRRTTKVITDTAEEKPKKTTRTRRKKTSETAETPPDPVIESSDTTEEKPKKTTRTRRKKTSDEEVITSTESTEEKPKPRRRTTRKKAETTNDESIPASPEDSTQHDETPPIKKAVRKRRTVKKTSVPAPDVGPVEAQAAPEPLNRTETLPTEQIITPSVEETEIHSDISAFEALNLSAPILKAVKEMGYTEPTPIQAQTIPDIIAGHDVLGVAQTGTGKTASFTLPLLEKLSKSRARARMPRSLILEPTRELALQVAENFQLYGKHLRLTHALLIGGSGMGEQRDLLNRGVDVLIATPGRLIDMFERGGLLLTQTDLLVIDEADRMLDMGFIPDIEKIVNLLPRRRQTLFFSATMAPEIRRLADAFLNSPKEVTVARQSSVATTITERLLIIEKNDKNRAIRTLLRKQKVENAIIFCNRKRDVDTLQNYLSRQGFAVGHLHGDLTQSLRFSTLERFRSGELKILVCSDVAARGIDINGLSHVFNYDLPFNAEDYVHRIGRTGRAGNEGHAISLATPEEQNLLDAVEKLTGKTIEHDTLNGFPKLTWREEGSEPPRPTLEDTPSRKELYTAERPYRKRRERSPLPEARRYEDKRGYGKTSLLPPVPEQDGMQYGFGDNVPAFMKVTFLPSPRDISEQ